MNTNKIELYSKIFLVSLGFLIPTTTAGSTILLPIVIVTYFLAGNWKIKYQTIFKDPIAIASLVLFGLYLIGTIYSIAPTSDILKALHKYLKLVFLAGLLPIFSEQKWRNHGINIFLVSIVFILITTYGGLLEIFNTTRLPHDFFRGHIENGFIMSFASFCIAHRLCKKDTTEARRLFYGIFLVLTTHYVFFINTGRTGYVAYAVLFLLFVWQVFKIRGLLIAIIATPILTATLFFVAPTFNTESKEAIANISQYVHKTNVFTSIGSRMGFLKNSLILIKQHPVLGTGTGSFTKAYNVFPVPPEYATGVPHPHNEYLMTAVQIGLVGLAALLTIFYLQLSLSFRLPLEMRNLAQGLVIAFMACSFCDSFLYSSPGYFFIYFSALFFGGLQNKKME